MPRPLLLFVLSTALVAGFSACGSDEDPRMRPSGPLSKAEYEQAFKASVTSLRRKSKAASDDGQKAVARIFIDGLGQLVTELDALQPPAEARQAHEDFMAGLRGYIDFRRPAVAAIRRGDDAEAERLLDIAPPSALRARILSALQFFEAHGYDIGPSSGVP